MWEQLKTEIAEFFNQPLPIIIGTIVMVLVYTLVIFSKTSLGRKALNILKTEIAKIREQLVIGLQLFNDKAKECENALNQAKKTIEEQNEHIAKLETLLFDIANAQSNVKVKKLVEEYRNGKEVTEDGRENTENTNTTTQEL